MTTSMLQDTIQTSPPTSGPRFRPYASPNHHVTKGRYITSNDPRGYIPVYEYPLNGQWIMMDIDDGYILWTGIWKALGNSKADIVKMIDSQPDLAPVIRRVRGGYLKIQGTWMPYEVALRLSRRVAYTIRDDLIPLFGPTFPSTCLSPDQPGYGQVVASGPNRRRARRSTQAMMHTPRDAHTTWTVVTPSEPSGSRRPDAPGQSTSQYPTAGYHPPRDIHFHHSYQHSSTTRSHHSGGHSSPETGSPSMAVRDRNPSVRYSPYMSHTPYVGRRVAGESRNHLSLDIPSLSLRDRSQQTSPVGSNMERITLPPIHAPADQGMSRSPYALPPISAMEDLRGLGVNDSAAVLRRLRSDDDSVAGRDRSSDDQVWKRRRSFSSQPYKSSDDAADSRQQTSHASRSYQDHSYRSRTPSESGGDFHRSRSKGLTLSVPSDASHDGLSTCDPSPISPATPRSAVSARDQLASYPMAKDHRRTSESYHTLTVPLLDWSSGHGPRRHEEIRDSEARLATRRHSDTDSDTHPHRPW
ncbi:hypothetical protein Hypma_006185 [Hypsizygus marmoreus]|uniref:HTH APSES-type domain-containing protein n=1 Tax=Hypsizygus marmoreus TaxID=39966 RepID=A0A369JTN8_HYPMA|nr:hypothetical protein Hypma_006185 [Hypsizygus marmoreus]